MKRAWHELHDACREEECRLAAADIGYGWKGSARQQSAQLMKNRWIFGCQFDVVASTVLSLVSSLIFFLMFAHRHLWLPIEFARNSICIYCADKLGEVPAEKHVWKQDKLVEFLRRACVYRYQHNDYIHRFSSCHFYRLLTEEPWWRSKACFNVREY